MKYYLKSYEIKKSKCKICERLEVEYPVFKVKNFFWFLLIVLSIEIKIESIDYIS